MQRDQRVHFRHELASALAILHPSSLIPPETRNLVAYLASNEAGFITGEVFTISGGR